MGITQQEAQCGGHIGTIHGRFCLEQWRSMAKFRVTCNKGNSVFNKTVDLRRLIPRNGGAEGQGTAASQGTVSLVPPPQGKLIKRDFGLGRPA